MDTPIVVEELYTNHIRLVSGQYVDPFNLKPVDVNLLDIAHGLSHRCRFTGHTQAFYSVAEHSLRVAELVPAEFRLAALLHDASEAYLFDIPSPIKHRFPQLQWLENQVMLAIASRFGFLWPIPDCIKIADQQALEEEWRYRVLENFEPRSPISVRQEFMDAIEKASHPHRS